MKEYDDKYKRIVIWGYCLNGVNLLKKIFLNEQYIYVGFADNSIYKQGYSVCGKPIYGIEDLVQLRNRLDFSVIIANKDWKTIRDECVENDIPIEAVFINNEIHDYPFPSFKTLDYSEGVRLYAGDICDDVHKAIKNLYGLSLHKEDSRHIIHDIRKPFPIDDNSISGFEAEDVFEYIEKPKQVDVINEIYRILKPNSCARFCLPDFNSPWVRSRAMKDGRGQVVFDAGGGGDYNGNGITDSGEVYFATYEDFNQTLLETKFSDIRWGCFYSEDGTLHRMTIDMSWGNVHRLANDNFIYSMVVDCWK